MKRGPRAIAAAFTVLLVVWVFGAFIAWDFDPGNWSFEGRGMAALIGFFSAFTVGIIAFGWGEDLL